MNTNYNLIFNKEIERIKKENIRPKLLLHACCAPCSSAVLEQLKDYFDITLFFYNPNISPESEFNFRLAELKRLLELMELKSIKIVAPQYDNDEFEAVAKEYAEEKEGGARCKKCYYLRLERTFLYARENNFDFVTTTLSVSPYKNAAALNELGIELEALYGVKYLISDFKKKNGYKRSCELSKEFGLYRQNYCGCIYSKAVAEKTKIEIKAYKKIPAEARAIREEVFIKEQGFKYEYDEIDNFATHFVLTEGGDAKGTLRIFTLEDPDTYILGRLAVKREARNKGYGKRLIKEALKFIEKEGGKALKLHSQLHAVDFYKKLGFLEYGEIEYEEDCPHIWMRKDI